MLLSEIAKVLGTSVENDCTITGVSTDTRTICSGDIFIAVKGDRFDGHKFIDAAVKRGACAVVSQERVDCSVPILLVEDSVKAYIDIAGSYRDRFDIPLIGLTGSVGKTTTKEMTALAVSAGFKTLKTEANYNNHIGVPKTLLGLNSSFGAAVVEMGMNHFGEISLLTRCVKPTVGIITNIGVSHIENLGSREGILKAKLELLEGMKPGAPLILNGDDDLLSTVTLSDRPIYFFGIDSEKCDFRAIGISQSDSSTSFAVEFDGGRESITLPTVGKHNVLDALAAFAAAYLVGVPAGDIANALSQYKPSGMRQRMVDCGEFSVIEDCYNASPDSMRAAISALADAKGTEKIAVLGDMLELGDYSEDMHMQVGRFAAQNGIDCLLCFGENSGFYVQGAKQCGMENAKHFNSREEFFRNICKCASDGAVLLFKASHGMHFEQIISELYERKGLK